MATGAVVPIYDPWTQCGINNPGTGVYNGDCGVGTQPPAVSRQHHPVEPHQPDCEEAPGLSRSTPNPTVAGRWVPNNFERNISIGGDNNQYNFRADYNLSQNQRLIGRFTRWDSTNLPVDIYGNGQTNGDPYSPEHFITTQVMLADTLTFNSTTVLDVRFGMLRWDYDRTPGNLGTNLVSTFGFPNGAVRADLGTQRNPGMETIPSIAAGQNQVIGTGLIYAGRLHVFVHADADQDCRRSHAEGGREHPAGRGQLLPEQQHGRHVYIHQRADGARRHESRVATGRSLRLVPDRPAHRRDVPVIEFHLRPLEVPGLLRSRIRGRSTHELTVTAGLRLESPGAYTETDDSLATFNPDLLNPLLAGRTNPETGKPFIGAFELVASDGQPERSLRKNPWQFAPRVGVAYRITDNTVLRAGGGTFYVPSTRDFQDGPTGNPVNNRTNNIATSVDNNRTFFTDLSNPFPTGVDNYPGRDPSFQQVLLGGTGHQFYRDEDGYPGRTTSVQRGVAASVPEQPSRPRWRTPACAARISPIP